MLREINRKREREERDRLKQKNRNREWKKQGKFYKQRFTKMIKRFCKGGWRKVRNRRRRRNKKE